MKDIAWYIKYRQKIHRSANGILQHRYKKCMIKEMSVNANNCYIDNALLFLLLSSFIKDRQVLYSIITFIWTLNRLLNRSSHLSRSNKTNGGVVHMHVHVHPCHIDSSIRLPGFNAKGVTWFPEPWDQIHLFDLEVLRSPPSGQTSV